MTRRVTPATESTDSGAGRLADAAVPKVFPRDANGSGDAGHGAAAATAQPRAGHSVKLRGMASACRRENPFGGDICAAASVAPFIARLTDLDGVRQSNAGAAYQHAGRSQP